MAEIRIVSPGELAAREQKVSKKRSGRQRSAERQRIIEEYKGLLEPAQPGYGGDVVLAEGEDKCVVRSNLKVAAEEIGKVLEFHPIKDKTRIEFRFITLVERAAKPKRGGRPKKVQLEAAAEPTEAPAEEAKPGRRTRRQPRAA